ncbi:hypothetical protein TNCV_1756091 [Trichonephila clavipes]|nr:hypothetical protein TNCV_1756091 [Trichonephila clavipes]
MVWGCMSSHGVGRLHIVSRTVKVTDYIEILQNELLLTARNLLGISHGFFRKITPLSSCKGSPEMVEGPYVNRMNWPGQSPDLNPIENLWFKIGYEIFSKKTFKTNVNYLEALIFSFNHLVTKDTL